MSWRLCVHGELEDHVLVGERLVHLGEGVQLRLHIHQVLRVQKHLREGKGMNEGQEESVKYVWIDG